MWIFTKQGFYSATMSTVKLGHIQVRARTREHLERLMEALPKELNRSKIVETPAADYRWRIVMTPAKWTLCMMKLAEDIDYSNFKNACAHAGLNTAPHHDVWRTMRHLQIVEENDKLWNDLYLPMAEPEAECPDCRMFYCTDDDHPPYCPICGEYKSTQTKRKS